METLVKAGNPRSSEELALINAISVSTFHVIHFAYQSDTRQALHVERGGVVRIPRLLLTCSA
jgi:hypothetical protein